LAHQEDEGQVGRLHCGVEAHLAQTLSWRNNLWGVRTFGFKEALKRLRIPLPHSGIKRNI